MSAASTEESPPFFQVTVSKLAVMHVLTLGYYSLVWMYLHWTAIREQRRGSLSPAIRGVLAPFIFIFPLFGAVRRAEVERNEPTPLLFPAFWAAACLLLSMFTLWRDSWWSLASHAAVFPLLLVQRHVNRHHAALGFDRRANGTFTLVNLLFCVAGGIYLAWYVAPLAAWILEWVRYFIAIA